MSTSDQSSVGSEALYEFARSMHSLGRLLVDDDASDIGYDVYYGRKNHYYHGVYSPDHPSPIHHYQIGSVMMLLSQVLGMFAVAKTLQQPDEPLTTTTIQPRLFMPISSLSQS